MAITALPNEKELLLRVARGDHEAFSELFMGYHQPLGDFLYRLTGSMELAEDIVQDAFIQVWMKREQLPSIKHFPDFLFIISRNKMVNALKKKANERVRHLAWTRQFEKEDFQPEDDTENGELYKNLLADAVAKLPPQQQKVYRMSRHQRMTYEQIAQQLGISSSTVKSHIQAAMQSIRRQLESEIDPVIILILLTPLIFS